MTTLERAIQIAAGAHAGQVDKADEPFILHPLRVMMKIDTEEGRMVAVLHDVIEDSDATPEDLRTEGFSEEIVEAVIALTKIGGESYERYIARVCENRLARIVKLADLDDNGNLNRIPEPTDKDLNRVEKYRWARGIIEEAMGQDSV